ncbi:alanyl-tRNA synthetase [Aaosphaeria arxii CBS 175.79]|uniref:Alanyl-tRNA synthetase n=1 Tax=Aaosphaeria arxii CBS 175.79 TaxID=1450172 RepID=A0A6A5Y0E1_9PLEO|nr:alanyl-tRNA synthetase [Aaosphaeria arxii CBS 175.79]KAF2018300.1 alanyl-tRNA synthetase [Aaosphaeria arxii CBS 175.79]
MADEAIVPTRPVYESDGDLRTLQARILSVVPVETLSEAERGLFKQAQPTDLVVTTDETIFHAQGGGQPNDVGDMMIRTDDGNISTSAPRFHVQAVRRNGKAVILHQGTLSNAESEGHGAFSPGSIVEQTIDGEKRELHSRIHTAGHLLGLAVRQLTDEIPDVSETKAQHFPGAAFVEFRGKIAGTFKEKIQAVVDDLVKQDLPVAISWMNMQQLKEKGVHVPDGFGKTPAENGTRVVEIGDLGGYPCGGTHVHSTAELVKVVVRKIAASKGNTKISYDVE